MRLYVNGRVPGKRPVRNPWTCSGFPRWNTFQGLGIESTSRNASRAVVKIQKGVKSHVHRKLGLHPDNIAHRVKKNDYAMGQLRKVFDEVKRLSYQLDRAVTARQHDQLTRRYETLINLLVVSKAYGWIDELIRLEACRGEVRTKITARRLTDNPMPLPGVRSTHMANVEGFYKALI